MKNREIINGIYRVYTGKKIICICGYLVLKFEDHIEYHNFQRHVHFVSGLYS
jgi:hypothetical protein